MPKFVKLLVSKNPSIILSTFFSLISISFDLRGFLNTCVLQFSAVHGAVFSRSYFYIFMLFTLNAKYVIQNTSSSILGSTQLTVHGLCYQPSTDL